MRRASYVLFALAYLLLSGQQISFRSPDLGRLLRDGQLILAGQTAVLHQNFYSYTYPTAPFPNHHWLTAVLAYGAAQAFGFGGMNLLCCGLGAAAFLLYFRAAEREAGLPIAAAFGAALMPLMIVRSGVRPEVFSMLLTALFFTILWGVYRGSIKAAWLWMLPALELLWVNLHPGFALGPVLIGVFLLAEIITLRKPGSSSIPTLAAILGVSVAAGVANPNGIRGLLFPLTVSSNYGISVRENLSMFQLQDDLISQITEVAALVLAASWVVIYRRKVKIEWPLLILSLAFSGVSLIFYRIYIFAGGFLLVALCANVASLQAAKPKPRKAERPSAAWLGWIWAAAAVGGFAFVSGRWSKTGLGLEAGDDELARFLQVNSIGGKVFNGYESGGYLLHYLPDLKLFIDSRPEAYPASFAGDLLLDLKDDDRWRQAAREYDFDFICFIGMNRDEGEFVTRRMRDPEWAMVRGGSDVVLLRRKPQFAEAIHRLEIRF